MRKRNIFKWCTAVLIGILTLGMVDYNTHAESTSEKKQYISEENQSMSEGSYAKNATGKKGISMDGTVFTPTSINEMGISQMYFNICLTDVISTDNTGVPYIYNGKTYYFKNVAPNIFYYTGLRIKELTQQGISVTAEILMPWTENAQLQKLIYPEGRIPGHQYYALNTVDAEAKETITATFNYLAESFGKENCFIKNWILGNEINSPNNWNYSGNNNDISLNVSIYKGAYDILYDAVTTHSPMSKTYICLDNNWTYNSDGMSMSSKAYLDEFAKMEEEKNWNLAFHPYAVPYSKSDNAEECVMWSPWSVMNNKLSHNLDTLFICGANIEVLTDYVKQRFGSQHRIILSEWGMDANAGEEAQAAGMLYTYYAAQRNDMIDACIYQPWVDVSSDFRKMGLLSSNHEKREIYTAFKYMDTNQGESYTKKYREYLKIASWSDDILYNIANNYWEGKTYYVDGKKQSNVFLALTRENPDIQWYYFAYTTDDINAGTKAYEIRTGWLRDEKTGKLHFAFPENGLLMANMWSNDNKYYFDGLDLAIGKFVTKEGFTYFSYSENATINGQKVTGIVQSGWVIDENTGDLYFCFPENNRMARGIQLGKYVFADNGKCLNP
ncbi:MAG: DUF5722 domain-containing protein [Lachnospiraceae bacterium]